MDAIIAGAVAGVARDAIQDSIDAPRCTVKAQVRREPVNVGGEGRSPTRRSTDVEGGWRRQSLTGGSRSPESQR